MPGDFHGPEAYLSEVRKPDVASRRRKIGGRGSSHFECFFHINDKPPEPVAELASKRCLFSYPRLK